MIPWFLVTLIDHIAWWFGYHTYVRARIGARGVESFHFRRRIAGERHVQRLKPISSIEPSEVDAYLEPGCRSSRRAARRARGRQRAAARTAS